MTAAAPARLRWAEVDLDAIRANVATLRALIPPPTRLAAVVKADAYGHGAVPVARAVLEGGAEWLTVATAAEALELRAAGIGAPVLLMGAATPAELGELIAAGVSLSVSDRGGIEAAAGAVAGRRAAVTGRPGAGPAPGAAGAAAERAMLHLKLDTGMHRLGAEAGAGLDLARLIQASPGLRLEALWTHFAEADDPTSGRTGTQLGAFLAAAARIDQAGLAGGAAGPVGAAAPTAEGITAGAGRPAPPLLHAANSAAALLHPAARLDLVRCGLPVYGYPSSPALAGIGLTPALSWHARVVAVHDLAPGERVGYSGTWEAARPSRVATLSAGYADGYSRALSNRGQILIGGRRAPVVGRVSMDFLTADVTGVPGVVVGDTATLLGRQGDGMIDAAEIAGWLGTIPWEVLCLIGRRVERVYGGEVGGER